MSEGRPALASLILDCQELIEKLDEMVAPLGSSKEATASDLLALVGAMRSLLRDKIETLAALSDALVRETQEVTLALRPTMLHHRPWPELFEAADAVDALVELETHRSIERAFGLATAGTA